MRSPVSVSRSASRDASWTASGIASVGASGCASGGASGDASGGHVSFGKDEGDEERQREGLGAFRESCLETRREICSGSRLEARRG